MTAPALQSDSTNRARISRNVDKMASQGATSEEIERYVQGEGLRPTDPDADFEAYRRKHGQDTAASDFAAYKAKHQAQETPTSGFSGAGAGGPTTKVPLGEGLGRAGVQGLTLGFGDELRGALAAPVRALTKGMSLKNAYTSIRDEERDKLREFEQEHPVLAPVAEIVGSLPTALAGGPANALRGEIAYGAASGLGHAEGDAGSQAKATGLGAALGGLFAGGAKIGGKVVGAGLDKLNPARVARRSMASVMPDDAGRTFAMRQALAPKANVPGDLSPETAALGQTLGKSVKTAVTGRRAAFERVKEIASQRKAVGKEYNALDRPLPVDPIITDLADQVGTPLANPAQTSFAEIHRLRHEAQKIASRARGMAKNDAGDVKDQIDFWLQGHVPEVKAVDARYSPLSQHLTDALKSLKATNQGAVLAAKRELGAGTRQGNRLMGIPSLLHRIVEPSPARKAEALQKVAFTPAKAEKELGKILKAQKGILRGPTPFIGRTGAEMLGGMAAPQLSSDTASATAQATQLRSQGLSNDQLSQQLSSTFTPDLVRFIVAATPQRMSQ